MLHQTLATSGLALALLLSSAVESPARTWTDSTGRHTIEGEFAKLADGNVEIRQDNGKLVRIPLEKLSEADQEYVRQTTSETPKKSPFATVDQPHSVGVRLAQDSAKDAPDDANLQEVVAEGVGLTPEAALKDALRNAVRQAVGMVVDAETLVKNDELIKDKVLTYSDAVVPWHEKISEKKEDELFRTSIVAKVQRRSLITKLKAANITVKQVDGASLGGLIDTKMEAERNAVALVQRDLEGYPENCFQAVIVGEPKLAEKGRADANEAALRIDVQIKTNRDAYQAFVSKLQKTLEAIALDKGEFSAVFEAKRDSYSRDDDEKVSYDYFEANRYCIRDWMPSVFEGSSDDDDWDRTWKKDSFTVAVNTNMTRAGDRTEWKYYVVDPEIADLFWKAANKVGQCKITLLDNDGSLVAVDRFSAVQENYRFEHRPASLFLLLGHRGTKYKIELMHYEDVYKPGIRAVLVSPVFFHHGGYLNYMQTLTIPRELTLSHDDIRDVARAQCELEFEE